MSAHLPYALLEVVWYDEDMQEIQFSASNGRFSGQTSFYTAIDELKACANHIAGFPGSQEDKREYEFGSPDLRGYGGAKLELSCNDALGHITVTVTICTKPLEEGLPLETSTFSIKTVPSAVDSFVATLRNMKCEVGESAKLWSAT